MAAIGEAARPRCFRFEGVVVDAVSARLVIDGRLRHCSQRALRLLAIFCESPGVVLSRHELLDRLWPGGQVVADEALTQAVFRARAVLGRYANRIVTVRGVGFRLDAQVEHLDEAGHPLPEAAAMPEASSDLPPSPAGPRSDPAAPPPVASSAGASRRRRWPLALGIGALLAALLGAFALYGPGLPTPSGVGTPAAGTELLDEGYALRLPDLHATHPDTPVLIRDAFANEAAGERARARSLLEAAHTSDPSSPVAAIFLALWAYGGGDIEGGDVWWARASQRASTLGDPYLTTLLAYVRAERDGSLQEVLRHAGALLDQRPEAWQLRFARAHLLVSGGYRDAARRELAQIAFKDLHHRKLATVLADRASLGDPDGAEAVLQRLAREGAPNASLAYVRGRIAWSRGDWDAARVAFTDCADRARQEARFDLLNRALATLGAIAVIQGRRDAAEAALEQAREGMAQSRWDKHVADVSLMLAQLHALDGDHAAAAVELDRAEQAFQRSGVALLRGFLRLYQQRLLPGHASPVDPDVDAGTEALLQGHRALAAGDVEAARAALAEATRLVPPIEPLFDEVRLLAGLLGETLGEGAPVDPPFPPMARLTTRAAIAALPPPTHSSSGDAP